MAGGLDARPDPLALVLMACSEVAHFAEVVRQPAAILTLHMILVHHSFESADCAVSLARRVSVLVPLLLEPTEFGTSSFKRVAFGEMGKRIVLSAVYIGSHLAKQRFSVLEILKVRPIVSVALRTGQS